ncbi:MAG: 5-(carboxyamino)imidazole ribonucleotide mutase, partial [Pseudomonadota bacterium]|nr:5-(carboxyamino)imidazole ribonucleotide mutase [Pseudomonadota bacterium]
VPWPGGGPVGTRASGGAGAVTAAVRAASSLAGQDDNVRAALDAWRARQTAAVGERPVDDA